MMTDAVVNATEHAEALRLLLQRRIGWFTTVAKDGTPRCVPVWFWWEDGRVFVLTEPGAAKVAHVRRGSPVLFHTETGPTGDDVVILHGTAVVASESTAEWLAPRRDAYVAKYADAIEAYGMPIDEIARVYSVTLVFTPDRIQAW